MKTNAQKRALKIAISYLIIAALYIIISDILVASLNFRKDELITINIYKGWGFVLITAILLFLTLSKYFKKILIEKKLTEEGKERFRELTDLLPQTIFEINNEGIITYSNKVAFDTFGYEENEVISKLSTIQMIAPNDRKLAKENISRRMRGESPTTIEYNAIKKDGTIFPVMIFTSAIIENETIIGLRGILIDLTEKKKTDAQIKKLSLAVEQSPASIIITDPEGYIQYANKRCEEVTGYKLEEMLGKTPRLFKSGQQDQKLYENLWNTIKSGDEWKGELHNQKKNGELFWELVSVSPIKDENDHIINFLAVKEDVTERKKSEAEFRSVWENSNDAMRLCDENGIILRVNKSFCRLFEKSQRDFVGNTFQTAYQYKENAAKLFSKSIEEGIITKQEVEVELWNEKKLWLEISNSVIEIGKRKTILSIFRDVSARKKYELELREAKEKAEEMNRIKSNFFSNMSHELRTPLSGILGFSEIMLGELEESENKQMINAISLNGQRLLETLNKILQIAKIESVKPDVLIEKIEICQFIKNLLKDYDGILISKGLSLKINCIQENLFINTDKELLHIILNNLISNAIKFTPKGYINIICKRIKKNEKDIVAIEVIDTGIGIKPKEINLIFEEFRQASEGLSRHYEGTGLGLTIVKKYTELLSGTISVESEPRKGSTFRVEFPESIEVISNKMDKEFYDRAIKTIKNETIQHKPLVLLVEDDVLNTEFMKRFLIEICDLHIAENGEDALKLAKTYDYNAILMDIGLGKGMNGIEVTKLIRGIPHYRDIPIIAVTAYAMGGEKEKFLNSGLNGYISKPFKMAELVEVLGNALNLL